MRRLAAICAAAALAALVASAPAQAASSPRLIKDINPSGSSNPSQMTAVGGTLFFAANDGVHGNELWKSDGTAIGTKMVKNIRTGAKGSYPENLVNVNGKLFFTAVDGVHGRELWKSDGTAAGTRLVKDLIPQCSGGFGCIGGLLISVLPRAVGSRVFLISEYCCFGTSTLYVSDGTANGTRQVKSNLPVSTNVGATAAWNGRFYFVAYSGWDHAALWVSDGTKAGTYDTHLASNDDIVLLPASGANLYFTTYYEDETEVDLQLWKTNGTVAGTKALGPGNALVWFPVDAAYMASRLYFSDGPGGSLWKTDGTSAGTKAISAGQAQFLTVLGGKLYFSRGGHLWSSNGTAAGTTQLAGFAMSYPSQLTAFGGRLFFTADDGVHGTELWSYTP